MRRVASPAKPTTAIDREVKPSNLGAQKQRVLLARTLYKKPSLLLLGEATRRWDTQRESQINDAVKQLPLTRIMVAHSAATIATAQRVVEMQGGLVVNDTVKPKDKDAAL